MTVNQKKHFPVTKARKIWVFIVSLILFLLVILIIHNLATSKGFGEKENNEQKKQNVQQVATENDIDWYQQPRIQKEIRDLYVGKTNINNVSDKDNENGNNSNGDDLKKAMQASISSNQITTDNNSNFQNQSVSTNNSSAPNQNNNQLNSNDDQNKQQEKKAFLDTANKSNSDYLSSSLQFPQSPFELQAGNIIPAVLMTGINSDLPGQIIGQVKSNVYDSISGNSLLIPEGTKVIGIYDSQIVYGQSRVLVAWQRLIFPNGQSFDLKGMPGVDLSGYSGFTDKTNNHYTKIFGSVILMSLLSAGAQLSQPQQNNSNNNNSLTVNQMIAQSLGTNIANTGNTVTQKNINIQPTLEIQPGYEFNITVTKDMVFPGSYTA
jgi:type IV secretory pathway VirB10-like protein